MKRADIYKRSGGTWYKKDAVGGSVTWVAPQYVAGSVPVGSANYTIPGSNVFFVSTTGNDSNPGTQGSPLATLAAAINKVTVAGSTIVVRGGTYHEGNIEAGAKPAMTIQNYPNEAVWFDGSIVFNQTWTAGTNVWTAPYTITFDRQLGKGANISIWSGSNFRTVIDQVWLDNVKLLPVADGTTPGAGQFSVNQSTDTLTIGSNPAGKTVRVVDLKFLVASGANSTMNIKGIGVKRYAPAEMEWRNSAVIVGVGSLVENVVIEHISLDALTIGGAGIVVRSCTLQDTGHSGLMGDNTANAIIEKNIIRRMNRLDYDGEPTTAGIKITRVFAGLTIRHNHIEDICDGAGIWFDTTVSRSFVINNTCIGVSALGGGYAGKNGIEIEGSDGGFYDGTQYYTYVVGNRVSGFRISGLLLFDNGWIKAWNNSLASAVAFYAWQDYRQNTGNKPTTEGTILQSPWTTRDLYMVNNIVIPQAPHNTQLRAQCNSDATFKIKGGAMFKEIRGNWFQPQGSGIFAYISDENGEWGSASTLNGLSNLSSVYGGPLGPIMENNVQGTAQPDDDIADELSVEIANAYGVPPGLKKLGPIIPAVTLTM